MDLSAENALRSRHVGAGLLLCLLALAACAPQAEPVDVPERPRVLLLGIDGADWDVIDPLVRAGYLPRLGALVAGGVRADLDCQPAMPETACFCPPVWVSIATGVGQDRHRIATIAAPVELRQAATIWEALFAAGRTSAAVSFRNTWPPEPALRYVLTESGLDHAAGRVYETWPEPPHPTRVFNTNLHTRPPDLFETLGILPADEPEGGRREVLSIIGRDRVAMRATLRLVVMDPTDLTVILLHSPDKAEHLKWADFQPEPGGPFDEAALLAMAEAWDGPVFAPEHDHRETVASQYLEIDAWLADLFRATHFDYVLVASDHGMARSTGVSERHGPGLSGDHGPDLPDAHHGVFVLHGPGVRSGVALEELSVFDVAPTLAYVMGVPVARDLEGRVVTEAFEEGLLEQRPVRTVDTWPRGPTRGPRRRGP